MRHLYDFYRQSRRPAYREFILRNARSIWDNDQNGLAMNSGCSGPARSTGRTPAGRARPSTR